jgi:hypoxanthine phosphoribosyltransferase
LRDIKSLENILFVYADSANNYLNYHLDEIEYGVNATEYLLKIYELIYPINNNIKIVYFCWNERKDENNIIEYIPYDYKEHWDEVSELIKTYLINFNSFGEMKEGEETSNPP